MTTLLAPRASKLTSDEGAPPAARSDIAVATVRRVVRETPDTLTFQLSLRDAVDRAAHRFEAGQFNMLGAFGAGEVPISICSDPARPLRIAHTIRSLGRVTNAFAGVRPGDEVTVRGPFGRPWPLRGAAGGDLLIVAGGLGLAPLRPAIYEAFSNRDRFRRVIVLVGARAPEHVLYRPELDAWSHWLERRKLEVRLTVDVADDGWPYGQGVVTTLFEPAAIDPSRTTAFVCGPEIMMGFAARGLLDLGMPAARVFVSLERNMQCGIRQCGHCQMGPMFVCSDGPVFAYDEIAGLMEVDEL
jgi:NAD(P)H-flavin reductase